MRGFLQLQLLCGNGRSMGDVEVNQFDVLPKRDNLIVGNVGDTIIV